MNIFSKMMNAFDSLVDCSEEMAQANLMGNNKNDLF